jgi:hypothetical protein
MKRQISEMENKLLKEIGRVQAENRGLVENINYFNSLHEKQSKAAQPVSQPSPGANAINGDRHHLNLSPIPSRSEQNNFNGGQQQQQQHHRAIAALENELNRCKQEIVHTEMNCNKIIKIDQNRLENVKLRFDEVKASIQSAAAAQNASPVQHHEGNFLNAGDVNNNEQVAENKEHFEVLRYLMHII